MGPDQDFEEKERERKVRRRVFHLTFASLALILGGFLIWKLSSLVLPIIVGALLAFLFRPVKDRFKIPWLPHELQVLCSFAAIGLVLFFAFDTARKHIPDDKQRSDIKVRLQYKLNEKYQQLVTTSPDGRSNTVVGLIQSEVNPLMDKVNELLELDPAERELFLKYRADGISPDDVKFLRYFRANQKRRKYVMTDEAVAAAPTAAPSVTTPVLPAAVPSGSGLE